ncbi:hypothetical protein MKEN_00738000 [Mycena kentingensis (nom. inval.)]|nr:hypothetical protein MKEN_00738000 [Mycena kentingensis (nom. inval.)]
MVRKSKAQDDAAWTPKPSATAARRRFRDRNLDSVREKDRTARALKRSEVKTARNTKKMPLHRRISADTSSRTSKERVGVHAMRSACTASLSSSRSSIRSLHKVSYIGDLDLTPSNDRILYHLKDLEGDVTLSDTTSLSEDFRGLGMRLESTAHFLRLDIVPFELTTRRELAYGNARRRWRASSARSRSRFAQELTTDAVVALMDRVGDLPAAVSPVTLAQRKEWSETRIFSLTRIQYQQMRVWVLNNVHVRPTFPTLPDMEAWRRAPDLTRRCMGEERECGIQEWRRCVAEEADGMETDSA